MNDFRHVTVLRDEVVRLLTPRGGCTYVDATLGGGGHSEAILEACEGARVVGIDRDEAAIVAAHKRLERFGARMRVVRARFGDAARVLADVLEDGRCDGLVADLGVSSPQIDDASRGMSFRREASSAPIDMRMDRSSGPTAREKIDGWSESELADVIFELGELDRLLAALPEIVRADGVACVISFHSLEDRRVKRAFAGDDWAPLTKKPIVATEREVEANPRARSAKLRAARRLRAGEIKDDRAARYLARKARRFTPGGES